MPALQITKKNITELNKCSGKKYCANNNTNDVVQFIEKAILGIWKYGSYTIF